MSDYIFKNYEKGFEETQVKLAYEIGKDWPDFAYATPEDLRNKFSQPEFDSTLRHYVFKGNEMVAFLPTEIVPNEEDGKKRANLDFPFVKKEHEQIRDSLIEKAINTLKSKGVELVIARVLKEFVGSLEQANKYGFEKGKLLFAVLNANLDKIKLKETNEKFVNVSENDREDLITLYQKTYNWTLEQATANFEGIMNPPHGFYAQPILREENKIISRGLLYVPRIPKYATFRFLTPDPLKYFDAYLSKITPIAKEKGSEFFQVILQPNQFQHLEFLKSYGFEIFEEVSEYIKKI